MVRRQHIKKVMPALVASLLLGLNMAETAYAEWDEWLIDTEIGLTASDNINHGNFDAESLSDQVWNGFASVGRFYYFSDTTRLDVGARIEGRIHHQYSRLNQISPGLKLGIRHKFGLGSDKPWIRGFASSGYIFSRSNIREGYQTQAGLTLGKPFFDRFDILLSYRFDHRESEDNNALPAQRLSEVGLDPAIANSVYDIQGHSVGLQLNTLLTEQWLLNVGYTFRYGDIVASVRPVWINGHQETVDSITNDDALPGWAYRANGITHTYSVDASYAFNQGHASINLGYQHTHAKADTFIYRTNLLRLNVIYNF